jgi:hypothetical protein
MKKAGANYKWWILVLAAGLGNGENCSHLKYREILNALAEIEKDKNTVAIWKEQIEGVDQLRSRYKHKFGHMPADEFSTTEIAQALSMVDPETPKPATGPLTLLQDELIAARSNPRGKFKVERSPMRDKS